MTQRLTVFALAFCLFCLSASWAMAAPAKDTQPALAAITLPKADLKGGMTLMQALNERHSDRRFSAKEISQEDLGNAVWSAVGVNRPDGKLTIPTALDIRDVFVLVATKEGVWRYDAATHSLQPVARIDLFMQVTNEGFGQDAPVALIYGAMGAKWKNIETEGEAHALMHIGSAYQNVGLYCASVGLGNIVRTNVDLKKIGETLKLSADDKLFAVQLIGYPEKNKK